MGTDKYVFFFSADHEQDWQPYPVDEYSAICNCPNKYVVSNSTVLYYITLYSSVSVLLILHCNIL